MSIRRGLMMAMASGVKAETITIPNNVITSTTDLDTYFSTLVDGWGSEIILLFKKDITQAAYSNNRLVFCWSAYALSTPNSFTTVGRMYNQGIQSITRSDWAISLNPGDEYYVVRFGTVVWI